MNSTAEEFLEFAKLIGRSKKIKRTGWVREGVQNPESVAEHCFRLIVLSMVLAPKLGVDQEKLIKMAILHDLGEVKTGDLVVERGKVVDSYARKRKEEIERFFIKEVLGAFEMGSGYSDLFDEMVKRESYDAKIFWQLDKLEMAIQASEYEYEEEQGKDLSEFFDNAERIIDQPFLKKVMEKIESLRKKKPA